MLASLGERSKTFLAYLFMETVMRVMEVMEVTMMTTTVITTKTSMTMSMKMNTPKKDTAATLTRAKEFSQWLNRVLLI